MKVHSLKSMGKLTDLVSAQVALCRHQLLALSQVQTFQMFSDYFLVVWNLNLTPINSQVASKWSPLG